jgi:hypothetical protein
MCLEGKIGQYRISRLLYQTTFFRIRNKLQFSNVKLILFVSMELLSSQSVRKFSAQMIINYLCICCQKLCYANFKEYLNESVVQSFVSFFFSLLTYSSTS